MGGLPKDQIGIITDGDIRRAIETEKNESLSLIASDLATFPPIKIMSGTKTKDAYIMMQRNQISAIPVIYKNSVIGIFKN